MFTRGVYIWYHNRDDITIDYEPAANIWVIVPISDYPGTNYVRKSLYVISVDEWNVAMSNGST